MELGLPSGGGRSRAIVLRPARAWLLLAALASAACGGGGGAVAPAAPPADDGAGRYVGAAACVRCHADIAASYARTGMGRAFRRPAEGHGLEEFSPPAEFERPGTALAYRMFERDGRYFQRQWIRGDDGREWAVDERVVAFAVGSGNHSRSYATESDGELFQMPACWYPEIRGFDLCPGYEPENHHFRRYLTTSCVYCHNGRMQAVPGTLGGYREPIPSGIGCERCHGPGERHVERWTGGAVPTGGPDPTIVNPERLPRETRIHVCLQCHLGDSKATERVRRLDRGPEQFVPGRPLTDVLMPFRFARPTRHDFGLSAQGDRLLLSRCYAASGGAIDCLTCHDPHVPVDDPKLPRDRFRKACLGCHAEDACRSPRHLRDATALAPDDCVACHMRRGEPDDQAYTEFTDHWIRRDAATTSRDARDDLAIEPVFPDAFAALPPGERAYTRARANMLLALQTADPRRRAMWQQAERDFVTAIANGVDRADTWFFLGKTRTYLRRTADAIEAYRKAVERDPAHRDAVAALASLLTDSGRPDGAETVLRAALARDPEAPGALAELGRCLMVTGRLPEALDATRRAIAGEPWNPLLRGNEGMILAAQGRFDDAATALAEAVRLRPEDARLWDAYARVLAAASRAADAEGASRIAARLSSRR